MKKSAFSLLFFFVISTAISFAQTPPEPDQMIAAKKQIESNYLKGLNSDNTGLKESCAYFLGSIRSEKALIPLMEMFRNAKTEGAKLVAAWSLLNIGNPRGVYLVKSTIDAGDCKSCMLRILYMDYCLKTNGRIDRS